MIIVKLAGGLGNQMFQYAFARHLAIKHSVELKLDVSDLNNPSLTGEYSIRDLGLSNFNIVSNVASVDEIAQYKKGRFGKLLDLIYLNLPFNFNKLYIREPFFKFYKMALCSPKDSFLDGYWQSENYFKDIRKELLVDFSIVSELSCDTIKLAEKICSENAVSIHIRKGDYISISENQNIYATCESGYYLAAMKKISDLHKDVVFYVFSDEPDWFAVNVPSVQKVNYVLHNTGKNSFQDLYLMSLCKHNIIANSSFSWWGAWLNKNPEKMVVAPKGWFKNNIKDTSDLIPKSWIQL